MCCQNVIISEGQKGICSLPDIILTETEVYGHEEWSTTSHISTGAQWYSASNVMENPTSSVVHGNVPEPFSAENFSETGLMEYAISKAGGQYVTETSSPEHYSGSTLMEYAISKGGGQDHPFTSTP